jgi:hypothetical protein
MQEVAVVKEVHKQSSGSLSVGAFVSACCTSPLTTRERSELIGAGLGAAGGAIIGSTVGLVATGALIGGPVGLIAGLLIGDQFMGQKTALRPRQNDRYEAEAQRSHEGSHDVLPH